MGEIISRNFYLFIIGCHWLFGKIRYVKYALIRIFAHFLPEGGRVTLTATSYTLNELNNQHFFKSCNFYGQRRARDQVVII